MEGNLVYIKHIYTLKCLMNSVKLYCNQMVRNMKIYRVVLYSDHHYLRDSIHQILKDCLACVFPESTVRWTGKNWKAWPVLKRQGKRQVSGQTWAVSALRTLPRAPRPGALPFHLESAVSSMHNYCECYEDKHLFVWIIFSS